MLLASKTYVCFIFLLFLRFEVYTQDQPSQDASLRALISKEPPSVHDSLYYELFKKNRSTDIIKAKQYAQKSLSLARVYNHRHIEMKSINALAYSCGELHLLDSALYYYKLGLRKSTLYNLQERIIYFSNDLGSLFERLDMYDSAIVYYLVSLEEATKEKLSYDRAIALNNIGLVFLRLENPQEALSYFETAVAIKKEARINEGININLLNIALCHNELGNFKQAGETANEAIRICELEDICSEETIMDAHYQLGYAQELLGNKESAITEYKKVIQLYTPQSSALSYCGAYYHLALLTLDTDSVAAMNYLKAARDKAVELKLKRMLRDVYSLYSLHHERLGNLEKSLKYKNLYIAFKDSIFNEKMANNLRQLQLAAQKKVNDEIVREQQEEVNRSKQITSLTVIISILTVGIAALLWYLYRLNKGIADRLASEVNRQTSQLQRTTRDLKVSNIELSKSKDEYQHLIYRASHDLRGPLTTLLGLTNLAKQEYDSGKEVVMDYISKIEFTATNLSKLLSRLVFITQVNEKELSREVVNPVRLINDLCKKISPEYGFKRYLVNGDESVVLTSDVFLLMMSVSFVLDNAFKYSLSSPDQVHVEIEIVTEDDTIIIDVFNDGFSITEELKPNIFRLFSVGEGNHGAGIGLYVAQKSIERIGGTVELMEHSYLTQFRIKLPRSY